MGAQGAHTKHAFESMAFARSYYSYPTLCFRLPRFVSPNHSVVSNQARGTPDLLDLMSTLSLALLHCAGAIQDKVLHTIQMSTAA